MSRKAPEISRDTKDLILGLLVTCLLALPFLDKAFHIDDPVVLAVSENVIQDPLDPLAGRIDWFGSADLLWEVTTNPPFLSYYLAPFLWIRGYSETLLHAAIAPFYLLTLIGSLSLARRFSREGWLPTLFLMTSPAVWVSMNLMRDVPALGLSTCCLALFLRGSEEGSRRFLAAGSILGGLAILTKYSAAVVLPILILFLLLTRRYRQSVWLLIPASFLLAWCVWTALLYGSAHPFYLLAGDHPGSSITASDKSLASLVILGSTLFLWPALIWATLRSRRFLTLAFTAALATGTTLAAWAYHGAETGFQYFFWTAFGTAGVVLVLTHPVRLIVHLRDVWRSAGSRGAKGRSLFLTAWFIGPILFSILFTPFQAVRHILLSLLPLILLAFSSLQGTGAEKRVTGHRKFLVVLLLLQTALAFAVHRSDAEYASTYRKLPGRLAREVETGDRPIWFVGHWGWKIYAEQAGFLRLSKEGPVPETGDFLIWPQRVHIGNPFPSKDFRSRLQEHSELVYDGVWPFRTMNFEGAAFYATIRRNTPYAIQSRPLEVFRVYRVGPPAVSR